MKKDSNQREREKISEKIDCRVYEDSDLSSVKSLLYELGYAVTEEELHKSIQAIQQRDGVIFVADLNKQVIGCICSIIDTRLAEGVYGEIVSLIVFEKFRGYGAGKRLVEASEKWLCKRVNKIRVRANEIRTDAHSFYSRLGFKETKNQKVFIKSLPQPQ